MRFYFYNCKSPYEHLSRANTDIEQLEVQVHWFLVRLPNQVPGLLILAKLKLLTKSNLNSKTLLIKVQRDFLFYTKWQVAELQSQAALFEVPVPDYPLIKQCRFFMDDHDDKIVTTMMLVKMIISLIKQCKIVS